jgi:hypothetical protein
VDQRACDGDLALEALGPERGAKVGVQDLDGNLAASFSFVARKTVAIPPRPISRSMRYLSLMPSRNSSRSITTAIL